MEIKISHFLVARRYPASILGNIVVFPIGLGLNVIQMTDNNSPIGIFDSGFGGLTVLKAINDLNPNESTVYIGDSKRYPYGPRRAEEIIKFTVEISRSLVERYEVKMIVVACNTASAVALDELKSMFDVPIVGVIVPGVKATMSVTKSKSVGVSGTVTTISSGAYQVEFNSKEADVDLHALACPGFVEFVERGDTSSDQVHVLAERLLAPFKDAKIDALLLGCTHYPFLARTISDVIGREVVLVSSADETAFEVNRLLKTNDLVADTNEVGQRVFLSSGDPDEFAKIGRSLLGEPLYDVMLWEP